MLRQYLVLLWLMINEVYLLSVQWTAGKEEIETMS